MISIRPMTPADVAIFRDIRLRALADSPTAFCSTHAAESALTELQWQEKAIQWTNPGQGAAFLAFDGRACCGIVACFKSREAAGAVDIASFWVAPEFRRQGIARQLLDAVHAWASAEAASALRLCVNETNTPAIACYRRYGFDFTGEPFPFPNAPALFQRLMIKPL